MILQIKMNLLEQKQRKKTSGWLGIRDDTGENCFDIVKNFGMLMDINARPENAHHLDNRWQQTSS